MLGARHPGEVGRLVIVDALPFYSLLFSPRSDGRSSNAAAIAFRDAMMAAPADQANAMQTAAIARLVKTEAARPAVVAAGVRSDRRTVADATYELMTTDLRPELNRITAPVEVVYAYDKMYGVPPLTSTPRSEMPSPQRRRYASNASTTASISSCLTSLMHLSVPSWSLSISPRRCRQTGDSAIPAAGQNMATSEAWTRIGAPPLF